MTNTNFVYDKLPGFHVMAKPTGPICNLDCKYCFYLEKENLYNTVQDFKMPDDVLESFIKQMIEAHDTPTANFAWQGGEPTLLGVEYFEKVVSLQAKYSNGKQITNAFQTNGVLLDDRWGELFAANGFLVGLSIDGPRELHDEYRVNKGNKPTFDNVIRGLDFLKKYNVDFNTLTVVHAGNSKYPKQVYNFLKEIDSKFMQFIPIVERISQAPGNNDLKLVSPDYEESAVVTSWSVQPDGYGKFLIEIFEEWVRNDVGKYFVQIFDVALEAWVGQNPSLCVFRDECGQAMAIEHNGDLYSCDHYVYPENKLGNIMESPLVSMLHSKQQVKFGRDKNDTLPKFCLDCDVRFVCNGECPKHRFVKTPDSKEGLNYLCAGYKKFFTHIDPYMRFMAGQLQKQSAPANVMVWAKQKDAGFPSLNVGRNDLCPCGSGKKYKNCCAVK